MYLPFEGSACVDVARGTRFNAAVYVPNIFPFNVKVINLFSIKVAEHSFRARFCWCNSARAQGLQKTNMPSIERSFYLLNTRTIYAIFLYNWTQCIALVFYHKYMLEKVKM